jgi:predicted DNA-binding transcriptional regulator AlpA
MQLLTESEAADLYRCTKAAMRRWRRENRGPKFYRIGRLIRYEASDLTEWLLAKAVAGSAQARTGMNHQISSM